MGGGGGVSEWREISEPRNTAMLQPMPRCTNCEGLLPRNYSFWRVVVQHESEAGTLFVLEHGRVSIQVRRELLHAQVAEFESLIGRTTVGAWRASFSSCSSSFLCWCHSQIAGLGTVNEVPAGNCFGVGSSVPAACTVLPAAATCLSIFRGSMSPASRSGR